LRLGGDFAVFAVFAVLGPEGFVVMEEDPLVGEERVSLDLSKRSTKAVTSALLEHKGLLLAADEMVDQLSQSGQRLRKTKFSLSVART
jgi:hypothetical protein